MKSQQCDDDLEDNSPERPHLRRGKLRNGLLGRRLSALRATTQMYLSAALHLSAPWLSVAWHLCNEPLAFVVLRTIREQTRGSRGNP
jgi:hypothetical protein